MSPQLATCLPDPLHPVSRAILDGFLAGQVSQEFFLWSFHLPNSDYLEVARCVLAALG